MTERYEKSPVKRPGFLNGAKSMDRPPGRRGPAKVCEAKFCGEKEEQGSGRMAFFVKNKKRRSKANFAVAAPRAAGPPGKFAQAKFHGEKEE